MSGVAVSPGEAPPEARPVEGRPSAWARLRRNRLAWGGLWIIVAVLATALAAPILPLPDPDVTVPSDRLMPPFSAGHFLGTDHLGRDMLARIIWGTRVSLAVGLAATAVAALVGSTIGLVAGYRGGRTDSLLMRGIDMLMAFPYLLLALAIVAALGPGLLNALFAISIVNIPFFARAVRGAVLATARADYVDAARMAGKSDGAILLGEILPNVAPVIVVTVSTTIGWMILETAGLSFLGLGAQPPQADLGSMLGDGRRILVNAPHVATIPGLVILVIVVAVNLLGDGLRDVLDPRLKSGAMLRPAARTATDRDAAAKAAATAEATPVTDEAPPPLLTVTGLDTRFEIGRSTHRAVRDVALHVGPGECLGIVGESGSGKSVTAMSIAGLVPTPPGRIAAGSIRFAGEELTAVSLHRLQDLRGNRIAYVFQDPLTTLNPLIPVGEQIAEAIRRHRDVSRAEAARAAIAAMESVRIPDPARRATAYPHALSGGMRRRSGIAMALANDPDLVIADEPTTALDVTTQAEILRLLNRLRRERGMALIFITHDLGVVAELCDRVVVMYAGEIAETGPVAEILARPRHPYTSRLLACVPRLGSAGRSVEPIPGLPPAADRLPRGCAFAPRCHLAIEACRGGPIPLEPVAPGHAARCIRWAELA